MQQAESIADQQRKCREYAAQLGLAVAPKFEFADEAVSGTKLARDGLDQLLEAARRHSFSVLFLENLSRLARESIISLPILKELVEVLGIRVISVGEGLDTSRAGWEIIAAIYSIQHERFVKDLGGYVFRGQEGVVLAGHSVGDMCFGYSSEPILGSEATRRGRQQKPRMKYIIDSEAASWVKQILEWFTHEKRAMQWIARELTRLGAPKDHRSTTKGWHPQSVRRVLTNGKYIGNWPWGQHTNKRNPFTGNVSQTERAPTEREKWDRHFPELRIVSDDLWDAAQVRLAELGAASSGPRRRNGQVTGSKPGRQDPTPRHLLAGLLHCAECGLTFQVSGARGDYLGCRGYFTGVCACETRTPRARASQMILDAIAERVLADPEWRQEVMEVLRRENELLNEQLPSQITQTRKQLSEVQLKIERLLDMVESGKAPDDVQERLDLRRSEKQALERTLTELERHDSIRRPEPTAAWVDDRFHELEAVLRQSGPAAALALRGLVGGRIVVRQIKRPGKRRHYLRASFCVQAAQVLQVVSQQPTLVVSDAPSLKAKEEIVVDLRELSPWERNVDRVKQLWDCSASVESGRSRRLG